MAQSALRVLAAAKRDWPALPARLDPETAERELVFIGLAGMMDPVRPEAAAAIARCRAAGIRPVMITGDHRIPPPPSGGSWASCRARARRSPGRNWTG